MYPHWKFIDIHSQVLMIYLIIYFMGTGDIPHGYRKFFSLIPEVGSRHQNEAWVIVELGTKWMPNSDSASNFMPEYKLLG